MTPGINFESLSYNPFSIHESSINSEHDPEINFCQDISSLETHYCSPNDFKNNFQSFLNESFLVLHLIIRSMNKNFESFKEFYSTIKFKFSIVCFSETWVDDNLSAKIRIFNFKVIRSYIKQEKFVREEKFVFLCMKILALN